MSYSSSNYYNSYAQPQSRGHGFPAQSSSGHGYPDNMNGTGASQSSANYGQSKYGYPASQAYTGGGGTQSNEHYSSSSNYPYQRAATYDDQQSSLNDVYSQGYYSRNVPGDTNAARLSQAQTGSQSDGLNSLAYASGLESTGTRSDTSSTMQGYGSMSQNSQPRQSRLKSPAQPDPRHTALPSLSNPSYPMQQQASNTSSTSQQLAINAAAALAGAVERRYANQNRINSSTSPQSTNVRSTASLAAANVSPPTTMMNAQPSHAANPGLAYEAHQHSRKVSRTSNIQPVQDSQEQSITTDSRRDIRGMSSIANLVSAARETGPSSYDQRPIAPDAAPTSIDPTAIFDPYQRERERKRQESERAAAEAKTRAEEAARIEAQKKQQAEQEAQKKAKDSSSAKKKQTSANSASKRGTQKAVPPANAPVQEEEVMAAEMKVMMEKMKAFQSKDPSLFKKLWNDMRQTGANAASVAVASPSPQPAQRPLPTSVPSAVPPAAPAPTPQPELAVTDTPPQYIDPKRRRRAAMLGPDGNKLHLNGYPVVVENNPDGLPDLGRFPAERRIRPRNYRPKSKDAPKEADTDAQIATPAPPIASEEEHSNTPSQPTNGRTTPSKAHSTPTMLAGALAEVGGAPPPPTSASKPSGTVWPMQKRDALTKSALRFLKANPANANIEMMESDLHKMLDNNPSYLTLCEMLAERGFKFHRGHFARELLNSIPDLGTAPNPQPASTVASEAVTAQAPWTGSQPTSYPTVHPTMHQMPTVPDHRDFSGSGNGGPPSHTGMYPAPIAPSSSVKTPKTKRPPGRPEPPPGSKEAAARKRDFSELIDLTDMDDDNYVMPDKHPRLEGPDSDIEMDDNPLLAFQDTTVAPPPMQNGATASNWLSPAPPRIQFDPYVNGMQPPRQDAPAESKVTRTILAKPLDKTEALKKQYYDPKTVARDILIASGRHPVERPLNVHLAGLLGKHIELDSDVSSFEWEEVDPGGPPLRKEAYVDIPAAKPRFKMGDRVMHKRNSRSMAGEKTRRPEKEKRDATDMPAQAAPAATSDTQVPATITVSSPVQQQSPTANSHAQAGRPKKLSGLRHSLLASEEHATPATFDPTRPQVQADSIITKPNATMDETPVKKKRGRPPGSKNKYPKIGGLKHQAADIASGSVAVAVPTTPTPSRDRYKCKWKKCSTVLHNLDTLRKHIGKVHRPTAQELEKDGYTCWWKKCRFLSQDPTGDWHTTQVYAHWEDWLKHIEKDHVTPLALKWGDGPSTLHTDPRQIQEDREKYLANKEGQVVTPQVNATDSLPDDVVTLIEVPPSKKLTSEQESEEKHHLAWLKAHRITKNSREESKEIIRAMKRRKELIGPGIDRGGCTLITEEMRHNFKQNPGIREIVHIDD